MHLLNLRYNLLLTENNDKKYKWNNLFPHPFQLYYEFHLSVSHNTWHIFLLSIYFALLLNYALTYQSTLITMNSINHSSASFQTMNYLLIEIFIDSLRSCLFISLNSRSYSCSKRIIAHWIFSSTYAWFKSVGSTI